MIRTSARVVAALAAEGGLRVRTTASGDPKDPPLDRRAAEALVRGGDVPIAVVLPKGFGETRRFWGASDASSATVQILADVSDPVAPQVVIGLLPGFLVMTTVTAAAAAGFGLMLTTVSRSRAQLSGISTIAILTMSAVGGSMFPRFLMSETMQSVGLVTFNAWALDGYLKVFWRQAPLVDLWPQAAVLTALTVVLLTLARLLARRWEE
jgi:hypothetical protein